jgi:hypothetical protein
MAFGQQPGPPASSSQVRELVSLLKDAGYSDFREARGPMRFSQRQAGGKFSRDEAAEFIARLQDEESDRDISAGATTRGESSQDQAMGVLTSEQLAGELRRRGWTVVQP